MQSNCSNNNDPGKNSHGKQLLESFCQTHQLPEHYKTLATDYFLPLAQELAQNTSKGKTLFVGINGCQGSGKSTLAELLTELLSSVYGKTVANLSIDDFYCTKIQRKTLAEEIHPLFMTRGVPGTHDIKLLQQTIDRLMQAKGNVPIPRFNKANDDRQPDELWDSLERPADIILLEGWCVGVSSQHSSELHTPINTLEEEEDTKGIWRNSVNTAIKKNYTPLFNTFDKLIMLKAPGFDCVYEWRQKQEEKLKDAQRKNSQTPGIMDSTALKRFIQHYQRLTQHMLETLPEQADIIFQLNNEHKIIERKNNENKNNEQL